MGRVKIKSVVEKDPNRPVNPILVKFEHASVKPNLDETLDLNRIFGTAVYESDMSKSSSRDMSHLSRSAFENRSGLSGEASKGKKRKQVVALQSDAMTYIGTKGFDNPSLPSSTDDKMKTYVALKDKKKLRIFEVTPITLSPYLKGHSHVVEDGRDAEIEKTREEKRARGIDLVKTFGTKRKRLAYERLEKNKIDISDMQESIDKAVDKLEVPTSEPIVKDEMSVLTLLPPCNRAATLALDVYKLEDILSRDELDAMDELVETFLAASAQDMKNWKESKTYSDYFLAMWRKLQPRRHDPRAVQNAKIVLYTECLIIFLKLKHDIIRRKVVHFAKEFPLWMREKVLDTFSILNANGTRNRPDAYKDKTCCYIMVLVLLANDLQFDTQLMSTSLNVHIKKLLTLARAVGITLLYNANSKEYRGSLKLPLPKQIDNRERRKTLR